MNYKNFIQTLGFTPKENTSGIFHKKYNGYAIEIDFDKSIFNFGNKIKGESKTTQNFSQAENWVVLECVDRLLEKGYPPQNIVLEKTWRTGHGTSGRLDVLVTRDDGSAYLMIECKTWGAEFEKEFKNLERNGGQLFTYFQQDKDADILMLYASQLQGNSIEFKNIIVKIEDDYRQAGNVKDFFERWNKLPKTNGIFDSWVAPYDFVSKALTKRVLKELKQEDSSFIFNRFLEILRHNVVSDKPNAFNKIFTLFLCKIVDEYSKDEDDELEFQWLEGQDNHITFQKRLTDLYNRGMRELLEKNVTDVSDSEFNRRFEQVDDKFKEEFRHILTEIRLKKNNEFAIKEVYDDASFEENAKVVKEVVELLQEFKIRYNYRQQFLSDFFELLLTTGLKQESGQFFTPVPIARFIIKSLPFQEITAKKIEQGNKNDLLPTIIDYAAGSGHFLTESMEVVQQYLDKLKLKDFKPETRKQIQSFQTVQFDWAEKYVYGIEKDYRLVKTAKVSCYLHGDGLAKVIHGDGLGDFATSKEFKDLLKETDRTYPQDNKQFDVIISNPPYSVSAFKGLMEEEKAKIGFDLYNRLTDQSSEIECLFIERTKQLLKDGGVAGIILPSSILSNSGIYTQTREILFKHFEILGIAELGSNTFMATGTNTVTLFLRRRNNADAYNIEEAIKKCFVSLQDVTINGIEKPLAKYVAHVWDTITFEDYKTLLQKSPNKNIEQHEIYKEYVKKIKAKNEQELWTNILAIEQDKLLYFILAYPQKLVLVKTGEKNEEKRFLGYEFSNRRGSEGIHAIQRSKSIDECTQLYDAESFTNPEKASTYIYKAFLGEFELDLPENLQQNLSYHNLVDMFTFDRVDFEKNISLSAKKKVVIESKFEQIKLSQILEVLESGNRPKGGVGEYLVGIPSLGGEHIGLDGRISVNKNNLKFVPIDFFNSSKQGILKDLDILICKDGALTGKVALFRTKDLGYDSSMINEHVFLLRANKKANQRFLFSLLLSKKGQELLKANITGQAQGGLNRGNLLDIKIPLPPIDIQKKIVSEVEALEKQEQKAVEETHSYQNEIKEIINDLNRFEKITLESISENLDNLRKPVTKSDRENGIYPYYGASGVVDFVANYLIDDTVLLISEDGANLKSRVYPIAFTATGKIWVNNHAHVLKFEDNATHKLVELYINQTDISEFITGQAQPKLNQKNLNSIKLPLPSIEEQKKILSAIEKIETKIAVLEKQIADTPKQKEKILKKYLE
ncbi:MAG: restriction endonuclease subunit S [Flavobacteriales bacterium]|nr:restriction endonuclease subunit S [Flavobacteriales bacterium]